MTEYLVADGRRYPYNQPPGQIVSLMSPFLQQDAACA